MQRRAVFSNGLKKLQKNLIEADLPFLFKSTGAQRMVPGLATSGHLGIYQKCKFSGTTPDLLPQKLCGWSPATCVLTRTPGDSDAYPSLRTTGSHDIREDFGIHKVQLTP